jgi:hypothetical protein
LAREGSRGEGGEEEEEETASAGGGMGRSGCPSAGSAEDGGSAPSAGDGARPSSFQPGTGSDGATLSEERRERLHVAGSSTSSPCAGP